MIENQDTFHVSRGEYKQPGGKLVAVQLHSEAGRLRRIYIEGDFFIDGVENPGDVVSFLENELLVVSAAQAFSDVRAHFPHAQFVGLDAQGLETAFQRAAGEDTQLPQPAGVAVATSGSSVESLSQPWSEQSFELLLDPEPRSPAEHMALDEILARQVTEGLRAPALRFWQWASSAVIIGLHQSVSNQVDVNRAHDLGFDIVRRMTGGGAMFVEPGNTITYSLYVPDDFIGTRMGFDAYKLCDEWALLALNQLGIEAQYKPVNDLTSPAGKIGGAAQRKFRSRTSENGAILHHVTMAYDIDARKMLGVLNISQEKMSDKAVKSAAKRVDPLKSQTDLSRDELCGALEDKAYEIIPHVTRARLDEQTLAQARALARLTYGSKEWTYKIP